MTQPRWTRKIPKKQGWYFWKRHDEDLCFYWEAYIFMKSDVDNSVNPWMGKFMGYTTDCPTGGWWIRIEI